MLVNVYSIALSLLTIVVLFFFCRSLFVAYRIVRYFDISQDSRLQIRLEDEGLLSSALIQFCCFIQLGSSLLFVFAADDFSSVLAGAMCATGSLLANAYGFPALVVKLGGLFFYGFWIVLHRIDISQPTFPLMKIKHGLLFLIFPLLLSDAVLQTLYLFNLTPDIVTSCCGTLFTEKGSESFGAILFFSTTSQLLLLFAGGSLLGLFSLLLYRLLSSGNCDKWSILLRIQGMGWLIYCILGLLVIILTISSYVYAMPYHNCPFDMLKPEYYFYGYPLYFTFFGATFCGLSSALLTLIHVDDVQKAIHRYQKKSMKTACFLTICFMVLAAGPVVLYRLGGADIF